MSPVRSAKRRAVRAAAPPRRAVRRRVRLDNDARRAQLLALGLAAFSERPYDEVSIDDIARGAGISKGLLYHYFPTKRDLYLAGLRATAAALLERTTAAAAPHLPPLERIRAGLDAYFDHMQSHARPFLALMRGGIGSDPEVATVLEDVRTAFVERLFSRSEGTPLHALAASDAPLVVIAVRGWIGFVEAASLEWLARRAPSREVVRDLLVDALLATMRVALGPSKTAGW
jgi:AcrR family transcriptional regulator